MKIMLLGKCAFAPERLAERDHDGSRGFQPTVGGERGFCVAQRRSNVDSSDSSGVAPRRGNGITNIRGLKPTATITSSLCDEQQQYPGVALGCHMTVFQASFEI